MFRKFTLSIVVAGMVLALASVGQAQTEVSVRQDLGMYDTKTGDFSEDDCRLCHDGAGASNTEATVTVDRHHLLYNKVIPTTTLLGTGHTTADADNAGGDDTNYVCLNCHSEEWGTAFRVVRDCATCHAASPHHRTDAALDRDCKSCHALVDNYNDLETGTGEDHYIPAYAPSMVTPAKGLDGDGWTATPGTTLYGSPNTLSEVNDGSGPFNLDAGNYDGNDGDKLYLFSSGPNNDIEIDTTVSSSDATFRVTVAYDTGGNPPIASWTAAGFDKGELTITLHAAGSATASEVIAAIRDIHKDSGIEGNPIPTNYLYAWTENSNQDVNDGSGLVDFASAASSAGEDVDLVSSLYYNDITIGHTATSPSPTDTFDIVATGTDGGAAGATWVPDAGAGNAGTLTVTFNSNPSPGTTASVLLAEIVTALSGSVLEAELDGADEPDESTAAAPLSSSELERLDIADFNDADIPAGACNYCHGDDADPAGGGRDIFDAHGTHHAISLPSDIGENIDGVDNGTVTKCNICHGDIDGYSIPQSGDTADLQIRKCEDCHGPDSLHNIQADSGGGTVIVGQETAGYGHVGANADCWGCHGFALASSTLPPAPVYATIYGADVASITAGTDTVVTLAGAGFVNFAGASVFESNVVLTAADGSSVALAADSITGTTLVVTIPADTAAGNYDLRAVKTDLDGAPVASNPLSFTVKPPVAIAGVTCDGTMLTITGSGFAGYAYGSGTTVVGDGANVAAIVSWTDTQIVAELSAAPADITVNTVFGSVTAAVIGDELGTWVVSSSAGAELVTFTPMEGFLVVTTGDSVTIGMEFGAVIFWMDADGAIFYGNMNAGSGSGIVFGEDNAISTWSAVQVK